MIVAQLIVAVGGQKQCPHPAQPASKKAQQVGSCLVGPVNVLHHRHGHRRSRIDLGQEGREQLIPRGRPAAQIGEFAAGLRADVEQRTERPGSQQAITGTPQPAGLLHALLERLQEHGLPHPRLPGHQDQPTVALSCFAGIFGQRLQKRRPLQQLHRPNPSSLTRL
jgi:hypothetical protein